MTPKLSNLNIILGYWNENSDSCFRFNNPKQFSTWIILVSFCSSHLAFKKLLQYSFYENLKDLCKNRFLRNKFKKVCVLQRRACNKFKRNYLENFNDSEHAVKTKNAPFFMIFPDISFLVVNYWASGPLKGRTTLGPDLDQKNFFLKWRF